MRRYISTVCGSRLLLDAVVAEQKAVKFMALLDGLLRELGPIDLDVMWKEVVKVLDKQQLRLVAYVRKSDHYAFSVRFNESFDQKFTVRPYTEYSI